MIRYVGKVMKIIKFQMILERWIKTFYWKYYSKISWIDANIRNEVTNSIEDKIDIKLKAIEDFCDVTQTLLWINMRVSKKGTLIECLFQLLERIIINILILSLGNTRTL